MTRDAKSDDRAPRARNWRKRADRGRSVSASHRLIVTYSVSASVVTLGCIVAVANGLSIGWAAAAWFAGVFASATTVGIWEWRIQVREVKRQLALGNLRRAERMVRLTPGVSDSLVPKPADAGVAVPEYPVAPVLLVMLSMIAGGVACWLREVPLASSILICWTVGSGVGVLTFDLQKALVYRTLRVLLREGHDEVARSYARIAEVQTVLNLGLEKVFREFGWLYVPLFRGLPTRPFETIAILLFGLSAIFFSADHVQGIVVVLFGWTAALGLRKRVSRKALREALLRLKAAGEEDLVRVLEKCWVHADHPPEAD